ncbi:TIGR02270 family protein [Pseudomonas aeruginosa]
MSQALSIVASGMVSAVGLSAPASCAAIRCALDNFQETRFIDQGGEWLPYPNTGLSKDTTKGTRTIRITRKEVMLKNKSYYKTSYGDEPGRAPKKGIVTSKIGKVYFTSWSMNVKFESKNVVRHLDLTTHNHFAAALGWLDWDQARPWVERLLASPEPLFRAIGLAACGMHRHDPGPALLSALGHADPAVLARAARTAGELRRRDLMANIRAYRAHDDPSLRFWANWATAQMGDEEALGPLRAFAGQPGPFQLPATMVLLAWQPRDTSMAWIRQLMQAADTRRIGIQATGLFGDPVAVPWLIQQMRDESLARVAGEAFSLITGADLALLDLELEVLPDYDPGPNDDPDDDNVALDDDENLSWPEAERVSAWWRDNGARFVAGRAYLLGEPLGEARCRQVLRDGQQRQRMAAACLLARFVPNLPLFPTGAPVRRQLDLF